MEDPSVKARLILAAAFILALPTFFAAVPAARQHNAVPFVSVAEAGRTVVGAWCDLCDGVECFCNGEEQEIQTSAPTSDGSLKDQEPAPDSSSAPGALLLGLLAILLWLKMR
jgi:hypothetical protein